MVGPAIYPAATCPPVKTTAINWSNSATPSNPQRVAIEDLSRGYVLVMDSRKDARAAKRAGDILINIG